MAVLVYLDQSLVIVLAKNNLSEYMLEMVG